MSGREKGIVGTDAERAMKRGEASRRVIYRRERVRAHDRRRVSLATAPPTN